MEVNRKGSEITIKFDSQDEAIGLHAFLSGTIHEVPADIASRAQWLYGWVFTAVQKLAHNFETEKSTKTMSPENMPAPPQAVAVETGVNTTSRRRKR